MVVGYCISSPTNYPSKYVSFGRGSLQITYSGKTFHKQGENSNKFKFFPTGPWAGIVSAAPAQANNIIE